MKRTFMLTLSLLVVGCGRGPRGHTGTDGATGADGANCSVMAVEPSIDAPNGGALITCGLSQTLVLNGTNGTDGLDAPPTAYSIVDTINPCGVNGSFDEVLLRLANGSVLASFSQNGSALTTRLVELVSGNYATTDSNSCSFSATINNDGSGNISWSGGGVSW